MAKEYDSKKETSLTAFRRETAELTRAELRAVRADARRQERKDKANAVADAQEADLNRRMHQADIACDRTAAPWIVDEVNTPNGVGYFINHLWNDSEGETHTDEVAEVVMDYPGNIALHNAHLLAAAPELLEALKAMRGCIAQSYRSAALDAEDHPDVPTYRDTEREREAMLIRIDRAVAKAEGRAS